MNKVNAKVIPYSSVVGTGLTLHNEKGEVLGQFSFLNNAPGAGPTDMVEFCEAMARAINAGQPERQITHTKKGSTYDVVASRALFQVSNPSEGLFNASGPPKARVVYDGDEVTVYRNEHGTFVRCPDEVVSPRFEDVPS